MLSPVIAAEPYLISRGDPARHLSRQVVVFGLPGAFTPVCTSKHVPGYVESADKFKAKGVDVVCVYVLPTFFFIFGLYSSLSSSL
jgi:hypothetical protein